MTTSRICIDPIDSASQILDHSGAQAYVSEVKSAWRREQWRLRQVHIREEDIQRFMDAFNALEDLAGQADADLQRMFVLVGKDFFDEIVKIIALTELQKERLHSGSSTTPSYIMSLDDIDLLSRVLRDAGRVASSVDSWARSEEWHRQSVTHQAYSEMCASLNQWSVAKGGFDATRSTQIYGLPSLHSTRMSAVAGNLSGPSRIPSRPKVSDRNSAGLRLHFRSASDPSSSYAHSNNNHYLPATPPPLSPSKRMDVFTGVRRTSPRKRSLDMRTPDTPTFHIRQSPKRVRQSTITDRRLSLNSEATLVDEPCVDGSTYTKGKGKEVERWLQNVSEASAFSSRKAWSPTTDIPIYPRRELSPESDIPMHSPIYFDIDMDVDTLSNATAGDSDVIASDIDNMPSLSFGTTPPPEDSDDSRSTWSGSSGGSDSSWASTVRDGDSPGEWKIVVHPEWAHAVQEGCRAVSSMAVSEVEPKQEMEERENREQPVWLRVLRMIVPFL